MLEVSQLSVTYGQHAALSDVALQVRRGELVVMLGGNGAGKSSLLRAICGLVPRRPGAQLQLDARSINSLEPHQIVDAGIALVPEDRGVFAELTVRENLRLGAYPARARASERQTFERMLEWFPLLAGRLAQRVRTMSGGEQQMVAVARALMSAPQILLLDEPSLSLSPHLCANLFARLRAICDTGIGILLVEQNARQSLKIADRGYLLDTGRIVGAGAATTLRDDPAVQRAYLGLTPAHLDK